MAVGKATQQDIRAKVDFSRPRLEALVFRVLEFIRTSDVSVVTDKNGYV